jgi:hypothetical protein
VFDLLGAGLSFGHLAIMGAVSLVTESIGLVESAAVYWSRGTSRQYAIVIGRVDRLTGSRHGPWTGF